MIYAKGFIKGLVRLPSSGYNTSVQAPGIKAQVADTFHFVSVVTIQTVHKQQGRLALGGKPVIYIMELNRLNLFLAFFRNNYYNEEPRITRTENRKIIVNS